MARRSERAPGTGALHERRRWVFEHIPPNADRLLDAGCHDGESTAAFARRVRFALGFDADVEALRHGAQIHAGKLCAASADAIPFADGSFDCVVFSEVMEHLPAEAEKACVRELRRVCREGGRLILTTPHRGRFWWLDPLMMKTHLRRVMHSLRNRAVPMKGHKHYHLDELRALLDPYFEIEHVARVGCLLYPVAYWGYLLPFGLGRLPPLAALWQRMMDADYLRECGDAAYNVCIIATARGAWRAPQAATSAALVPPSRDESQG